MNHLKEDFGTPGTLRTDFTLQQPYSYTERNNRGNQSQVSQVSQRGAENLLRVCRLVGIEFWLEGGKLRYRSPKSILTDDLLEEIREHKSHLVSMLAEIEEVQPDPHPESAPQAKNPPAEPSPEPSIEPWQPRQLPWRAEIGSWTIPDRQKWGRRANELAEDGIEWPDDERLAYEEITNPDATRVSAD